MKVFKYTAKTSEGKTVQGKMEARSRDNVAETLIGKKLVVIKIEDDLGISWDKIQEINVGGVPIKDKVIFMRQLATMVGAGLPLTQALEILEAQSTNPMFKRVIAEVLAEVQGGSGLAEAFKKNNTVFDSITLNLLEAGEESGNLQTILERLAVELEEQKKLGEKLKSAMIYPTIIVVVIIGVIVLMMFVLVPAMAQIYGEFGADLPAITQMMINMSNFFIGYWWFLALVISLGSIMYKYYYDSPEGKKFIHRLSLKLPVFGMIVNKMQIAQFTRLLSLLLKSGLSIVKALQLTAGSLSNVIYREAVMEASREVEKGVALAIPIARAQIFPLIISQMIAVGEESGEMDNVLEKMSEYYNEEVTVATNNLATLMEPLMLVLMGGAIAFIALAVYMPMFNLSGVIG